MKRLILFLAVMTVLASCMTPKRAYKKGHMDQSIHLAVKKLRKRKIKDKDIIILEKAFAVINQDDYNRLQNLLSEVNPNKWPKVNRLAKNIYDRQQLVKAYLPLRVKSQHRKAAFKFFPVKELMIKSKEKAAQHFYQSGLDALQRAKKGNRKAARSAFAYFDNIKQYYDNYKDTRQLMEEAHQLGIAYAVIGLSNETSALLPRRFKNAVLQMYPNDLNTYWTKVDINPKSHKYDYKISIRLTNIAVSPQEIRKDHFIDEKEIKNGTQYVLDNNGNVAKDTLGNDIVEDKYEIVRADVFTTEQHKATMLTAFVDVINTHSGQRLMSREITAEAVFSNRAGRYEGDKRALARESKKMIGNHPVPFPSDESMLIQAAEALSPKIKDIICNNMSILENE